MNERQFLEAFERFASIVINKGFPKKLMIENMLDDNCPFEVYRGDYTNYDRADRIFGIVWNLKDEIGYWPASGYYNDRKDVEELISKMIGIVVTLSR